MEEKEIGTDDEKINDDNLTEISGGSWQLTEFKGKRAGITLRKADGSEGKWGNLWNTGDYYWHGKKLTNYQAYAIASYYDKFGREPSTVKEATEHYKKTQGPEFNDD